MKILLITSFFPPTHTAGTEKRTLAYALGLQKLGYEVQVVCAGDWDEGQRYWNGYTDELYQQIPVRRIHLNWTLAPDPNQYLYYNSLVEKNIGEWLQQWQPDLVHITSCLTLSASVIQVVKDNDIPLVLTLTDFWFICPRVNLLKGDGSLCTGITSPWDCLQCKLWDSGIYHSVRAVFPGSVGAKILTMASKNPSLNRQRGLRGMALNMEERKMYLSRMLQFVDCITAPSAALANIIRLNYPSKDIKVILSGHDLSWTKSLRPKKPSDVLRIAYIGQIIPIKGIHTLLSAFCSSGVSDRAELIVFGDPSKDADYFRSLEDIVARYKATVRFQGPFPHDALGKILSEIDVLVVPSLWHENNPRVIQEAFAARTPVIATNVTGISEFVQHESNGLLFERGDADDLAGQLKRLVNDASLLEKLKAGIPNVRSVDEEVLELENLYLELTQGKAISINRRISRNHE